MTVWYFDCEGCSGVFSTKEKALASYYAGAKSNGMKTIHVLDSGNYVEILSEYDNGATDWLTISAYELDEDNFG